MHVELVRITYSIFLQPNSYFYSLPANLSQYNVKILHILVSIVQVTKILKINIRKEAQIELLHNV